MGRTAVVVASILASISVTVVRAELRTVGFNDNTTILTEDGDFCPGSELLQQDDGSFENGWAWENLGVVPPDYGAWAECYNAEFVCGIQFLFTDAGYFIGQDMDVYVWDDDQDNPGTILCMLTGIVPDGIAQWPEISTHDVQVCCVTGGGHFVGFWGNWPNANAGWYIVADEDGPGAGCPRTKFAPGLGYPTGWHHPNEHPLIFNVRDLGIREHAGLGDCMPTATTQSTWGRIKALY